MLKKAFTAFVQFAPGVILLGFLLGALLASVPAGWPRYAVSLVVVVIAAAIYIGERKDQRERRLADKIKQELAEDF